MPRAYLSLGSNIEPERNLRAALRALRGRFGTLAISPAYRSAAVGFDGPAFWNLAVGFDCELDRAALRAWLRELEIASGRRRDVPRYSDRTLDLDVALWCEGDACSSDLAQDEFDRAYVLAPLAGLAPAASDPFGAGTLAQRSAAFADGTLEKLDVDLLAAE